MRHTKLRLRVHAEVIKATLAGLSNLRGDQLNIKNRSMSYATYTIFTWWVHNRLGRVVRKAIPSCGVWAIRVSYSEENLVYTPFQEARDEMAASL